MHVVHKHTQAKHPYTLKRKKSFPLNTKLEEAFLLFVCFFKIFFNIYRPQKMIWKFSSSESLGQVNQSLASEKIR